ncbi:ATP-binding protein [Asticcacaulis sp. 201]|uniref:ATP-binding protein n=1 Tax=Asticcacaulis sp. 201 TaxID=3028787 RepID=UPI002916837D|nr:ATP-binding protein [Asticcacaulis sp. 201]MDV6331157.1 ATP-binding protein [Asticcacaulis sp. 201]
MKQLWSSVINFVSSLKGRLTLILVIGMSVAAVVALLAAETARQQDYQRLYSEKVLASAADVASRLQSDAERTKHSLQTQQIVGAQLLELPTDKIIRDDTLTRQLTDRIGVTMKPGLYHLESASCIKGDPFWVKSHTAGILDIRPPDCWLLTLEDASGKMNIGLSLPNLGKPPSAITSPLFLTLVFASSLILSLLTARLASAPLRRLSQAADAFAHSIDAPPVVETGPSDVRAALTTFNLMQERVREGVRERTRVLAAISHDLQTPLTRLRLRLELVEDEALRTRLINDLSATLAMVKRGLDLARSGESAEDWTLINVNSLLSSLADDAADIGHKVRFIDGPPMRAKVRPDALHRCLMNLIDNAVKYGGGAELSCVRQDKTVRISIRDHGPGMSPELLARAFEPFVRGDTKISSGDGTGIGLTIAKAQAAATRATLIVENHPAGGLSACVILPN